MRSAAARRSKNHPALILALGAILFCLVSAPATGNVLPESAILVHVQSPAEGCVTEITTCDQIVRSTTADGPLEFLFFVYPLAFEYDHYPIRSLDLDLVWPSTWEPTGLGFCGGGIGDYQQFGPNHYGFHIDWYDCPPIEGQIFLAMSLCLDVNGPGRLEFTNPYETPLGLRCGQGAFDSAAFGFFAEAGMDCGYTRFTCARAEFCTPQFDETELVLTAPMGGVAVGELPFTAYYFGQPCALSASARDDWATAEVLSGDDDFRKRLVVTADAGNLEEGIYLTRVQVENGEMSARCVDVTFHVEGNASTPDDGQPVRQVGSWGRIKAVYR